MRALVTGATGFLGSRLTELLVDDGHAVAILRRESTRPWRIEHLLSRVTTIFADLENPRTAAEQIVGFAPEVVFHTGWYGVSGTRRNEVEQIVRNLGGTATLVELAAQAGCRNLVALGSQAEYGPQNRILDETAAVAPTTTYGVAKQCAHQICRHLAAQAGMRLAWVRVFSLYGPGDTPDFMIPSLVRKLLRRERPSLTGGEQLWDYLYIQDAAEAVYRLGMTSTAEGVFNLGSGRVHTIRRIVEQIRDLIDPGLTLGFGEVPYRPDQVMHLQADISRLTGATGWEPRTTLADGLAKTVAWYRTEGENE